ncbi:TonB-dependent receptor domain-containing protein [Psychrobium sp. 1_MG-2023]|uniref:TonB-dependent receptor domain-containing protein n=1 Tax=Psychrobium sp. 1_MG-2023 TaxID=3062624 RepID=UPI000C321A3D|nr:TonB-dependent receptor [Psychrobium sp. 1_MG-2023]MDP2560430.1 TonB-dependent receptor [Psychrobium sp. 1_MG-2023]PKF57910.1 TonB-dependent receptor [Alteromonadales bacterium alter-6D02]
MKHNILTTTFIALGLIPTGVMAAAEINETMLVTADRTQQEQFLALSATKVIDKADIEAIQPHNVTDLLDQVAGISVVNQGGGGQQSSLFMRGTNNGHTLVLVDGVRVGSATLGSTSFGAMSADQIERIEIVKGPRAALWGSDAIGGVIQIFTKKLQQGEGSVSVGLGSNGLWKAAGSVGFGNEEHNLTVNLSTEESDGFSAKTDSENPYETDDDGYDRLSLGMVGQSVLTEEVSLHLASRWEQGGSEYDASSTLYANEQEYENYLLRLAGQYQNGDIFSELSVAASQDQGETFGNDIPKSDSDEIKTKRNQLSWIGQYSFTDQISAAAGFDWYDEEISTTKDKVSWLPGFQTWAEDERTVKAFYLQTRQQYASVLLELAVRHDDVERLDSETTYNASVGYQLNEDLLVSLNHSTGFKAPSFNDLYWPGSGNADLKPETIKSYELLIRNQFDSGNVQLSFFDSKVDNLIAWAPNKTGAWQPSNINEADIRGVELTLERSIGETTHELALAYVDATDSKKQLPLARRPQVTANYTVGYQWQDFTFNGVVSYRDESAERVSKTADILEAYWLVNASVNYQATSNLAIAAKVNNLFDEEYETAKNYVADGTNFVVSATYSF